jgi:pyruvate dehydrogenase E2 component (dihydrolipoamide acetyltransferase)
VTTVTTVVVMPRLSDAMEEGTVVRWFKTDGDLVEVGDELVEIETDKATMPYEAETSGVLHRLVEEGESVALGAPLAELLPEGAEPQVRSEEAPIDVTPAAPVIASAGGNGRASNGASSGRTQASPVARRLAAHAGIDLATLVPGSGPRGRIVRRDVQAALAATAPEPTLSPPEPTPPRDAPETVREGAKGTAEATELSRLQQTVARRMAESRATVPDFSIEMDVDADELVALRKRLKAELPELAPPSFNDFVVKASARALAAHPRVNGAYRDGSIEHFGRINVGVAVAADDALLVPVVTDADVKSVGAIAADTRRLADLARTKKLTPPELAGGTFTVSNLGMFGVTRFSAVINTPQAAILAVGALEQRPVVRDGELRVGHVMTLTLCSDHRILYGADAAAFLADIRAGLEQPLRLLV